jgi:hypothetical protein
VTPLQALDFSFGAGKEIDFFDYGDSIGFFDNLQLILPSKFYILFEIARTIFTGETTSEALCAIDEITKEEKIYEPDRAETIQINRVDRTSPLSDRMEIEMYRTINDLKKALPRELAQDDDIFSAKLFTKTLMVQKFYESEADSYKPISTTMDERGKEANKFEQKFYILMDRSRSMDLKFRSYYSKCIVAEFFRRKLNSKAKLYYRAFDSKIGELCKIEKREDFPSMIENVLMTDTGGSSTNLQEAVFQAIKDIEYDKEMLNAEILVITDGVSKINKHEMRKRLGSIRLNVMKIGDELAEADYYELKRNLDHDNVDFDPTSVNLKNIKKKMDERDPGNPGDELPLAVQRAYRLVLDHSENVFKDLREISHKYIEIADLKHDGLFIPSDEHVQNIKDTVERFLSFDFMKLSIEQRQKAYKKVYFFCQYLQQLIQADEKHRDTLQWSLEKLNEIKQRMLKDMELLFTIRKVKELDDDKKLMKLAKKEARKLMKQMQLENRKLSIREMKKAQVLLTMDVGEGSMGQFILLLLVKLYMFIKESAQYLFKGSARKKEK